jgi:hypothetical protein
MQSKRMEPLMLKYAHGVASVSPHENDGKR